MIQWLKKRPLALRALVYVVAAVLAFGLAAGVGATGALILQGDLDLPRREEHRPSGEQENADRSQEKAAAEREEVTDQQSETEYINEVGDIQAKAVETFMDSHDRLLLYDALTADDIDEMAANRVALEGLTDRVDELDPPQEYGEQYGIFDSAVNELREAAQLAYDLAADPYSATQSDFEAYDHHVDKATAYLRRSNEMLGRDYRTTETAQEISLG